MTPIQIKQKPVQICVVSHWCDQLQGEKMAHLILRLTNGGNTKAEVDLFDLFQRGEDLKYIHSNELKSDSPIVAQAAEGDCYELYSICGVNGEYVEDPEVEGTIPYDGDVRVFMLQMQINHKENDGTAIPPGNISFKESTEENTDFKVLWTHIRENLITMGRIKQNGEVPANMDHLWK